jgi:hypothetical protein
MNIKVFFFTLMLVPNLLLAQNIPLLSSMRDSIFVNAEKMSSAKTESGKYLFSDRVDYWVEQFIKQEKSIEFPLDSMKWVGVVTSRDLKIRIFTWAVPLNSGRFAFKGYAQTFSKSNKSYHYFKLVDKTDKLGKADFKTLSPSNWYGAYYYRIVETKRDKKVYYSLIGWKGIDKTKQCKLVEIATLKSNGDLVLGYNLFSIKNHEYFGKTYSPKRLIFTYSVLVSMHMDYDRQSIILRSEKEAKPIKKASRKTGFQAQDELEKPTVKESRITDFMIVMDRLVPTAVELTGFFEFYYPESNVMDALRFEKNTWKYYPDIDARNQTSKTQKIRKVEYDLVPSE